MEGSQMIEAPDSLEAINELFYSRGMTDGLPIIPPTPQRVETMLKAVDRDPKEVVGIVPPRWAPASVEKIAINAVMAGCLPQYLPVVIAAVEAVAEDGFNLYSVQATTNPVSPLLIINGPVAKELSINSGYNCLGQGNRANATIGRALRLVMTNIGGGIPGELDRATTGWPGKYTFCFAENEAKSPWPPLHVERGFDPSVSTVTAFGAGGFTNMIDGSSKSGEGVLTTLSQLACLGGANPSAFEPLIVLCPEHAALLARDGFSKEDVKRFIFENARVRPSTFTRQLSADLVRRWTARGLDVGGDALIPIAHKPEDIIIVVAGGAGAHSVLIPSTLAVAGPERSQVITKPIKK